MSIVYVLVWENSNSDPETMVFRKENDAYKMACHSIIDHISYWGFPKDKQNLTKDQFDFVKTFNSFLKTKDYRLAASEWNKYQTNINLYNNDLDKQETNICYVFREEADNHAVANIIPWDDYFFEE